MVTQGFSYMRLVQVQLSFEHPILILDTFKFGILLIERIGIGHPIFMQNGILDNIFQIPG